LPPRLPVPSLFYRAGYGAIGDNGPAAAAQFEGPVGIAFGASGQLYIADSNDYRVRMVADGIVSTVAGTGAAFFGDSGDGGPATSAALTGPVAVAPGPNGSFFIGDQATLIRQVVNGIISTVAGQGPQRMELANVTRLATDPQGNIYVADMFHNVVHKISNGTITTVAGNGSVGYSGDTGPALAAQLWRPEGVAVDASGNLYVSDSGNQVIRKVSVDGIITTFATGFLAPGCLALDNASNLYVVDEGNNVVRKVSQGITTTIAGGGASFEDVALRLA
jgi:streptogramin lyase